MPRIYRRSSSVLAVVSMLVVISAAVTACGPEAETELRELVFGLMGVSGVIGLLAVLLQLPFA